MTSGLHLRSVIPPAMKANNLTTWDAAPRRLDIDGRQLRLGGFQAQHPHTVDVIGPSRSRLTLLVLPRDTDRSPRTGP